jgi:hypothetical protein
MNDVLRAGGLLAAAVVGATAIGLALLLARDPELLKRLVKRGAISYQKAMEIIAETREELGDVMAEALQEAEEELRGTGTAQDTPAASARESAGAR